MPSTSVAAEQAALDASTAAVASELAGQLYRIPALRERIEDHANNVTRFLVIGRRAAGRTGRDKTSILFSIRDEVGTLHRILEPFASARLSLTKIESRPTRRRPWEYVFFVDFEGHRDDPVTQGVLAAVRERCLFLKVLGLVPGAGVRRGDVSTAWERLANEPILDIHPYQPGKPIEELERELGIPDAIKLASNENPFGPPPGVLEAIRKALAGLNRYPDGSGYYLRQALAKKHGVSAESIVLGNGSNELIELLARTFVRPGRGGGASRIPSFVVYPSIVQAVGGIRVVVTLKDHRHRPPKMRAGDHRADEDGVRRQPEQPDRHDRDGRGGRQVPRQGAGARHRRVRRGLLRVRRRARTFPDTLGHLRHGKRVVVLRTFSKMASLAGLRVGYAVADPDCIALMNRIRQPFNVNTLAQVAALAALDGRGPRPVGPSRPSARACGASATALDRLGVHYVPSRANFILVELARCGAASTRRSSSRA